MKTYFVYFMILFCSTSLTFAQKLAEIWKNGEGLDTPESVCYNPETRDLYVSNLKGAPNEKNGDGFISRFSLEGKLLELKWVKGINAPKGMAIFDHKLYVTDIDQLLIIDLSEAEIVKRIAVPGAAFLNDVAIDEQGIVYFTDSAGRNSSVYRLKDGELIRWLDNQTVNQPNGLYYEKPFLYVGSSGEGLIRSFHVGTKEQVDSIYVGRSIDGLKKIGDASFLVSDWQGKTAFIKDSKDHILLDTADPKVNSADFEYIPEKHLLIIPTFFNDRIVAYRFDPH